MFLTISLVAEGWAVMTDNESGSANLVIPIRPNAVTLSFVTVEQFDNPDDAKLAAAAWIANGVSASDFLASLEEGEDEKTTQIAAAPATAG